MMGTLEELHGRSLALLTDLYELTMAQAYFRTAPDQEGVFHLLFRRAPFGGSFALAAGLEAAAEHLGALRFGERDLAYLAALETASGSRLFDAPFLDHLGRTSFACEVDAVAEGTVVFPGEPLVRVEGPIVQAQLVETALLTLVGFQTLIATKAARVAFAARGDEVIEFGLRRAQGVDGGLSASRAAYLGGCSATSNLLAGELFGIPVRGTHAHSWVMSFEDELEAFRAWAEAMAESAVLLVDTYDTVEGVRRAARVGLELRARGGRLAGVRLDSGDLGELSRQARAILDEAGLGDAAIVASGDLDEHEIDALKTSGAPIDAWGVGTRLVTGGDQPALGGVYKLGAVRRPGEPWQPRLKLSDDPGKATSPGRLGVLRLGRARGPFAGDVVHDLDLGAGDELEAVDLETRERRVVGSRAGARELLEPLFRRGRRVRAPAGLEEARARARDQLEALGDELRALRDPARYPVGLEAGAFERKMELASRERARSGPGEGRA